MHTVGEYIGAHKSLEGDLVISFCIEEDDMESLKALEGSKVVIDVSKFSKKRSLNANAYFWKLCDLIAKKLGSDKDTIYLMMLRDAGVFDQYDLPLEAVEKISKLYRYAEIDHEYTTDVLGFDGIEPVKMASIKCYTGSHEYDSKQMAELINHTVNEAHNLGIETWTREEIDNLIKQWKGHA